MVDILAEIDKTVAGNLRTVMVAVDIQIGQVVEDNLIKHQI